MKTEQKKTAYCFLLVVILLMTAGILGVGITWASYGNRVVWNTLIHPRQPIVSNCLTSDGQVILLGELTEERQVEVWFDSPMEDSASLSLEWLDPSQEAYLEASLLEDEIALSEGRTYGHMRLVPTQLASELEEAVEVELRMTLETTENEVLFGIFRLTLPAKEKEYPAPGGSSGTGGIEAEAGKTVTLTFTFEDVFNVDGIFTVNDTDAIVSQYTIRVAEAGATAALIEGDRLWAVPSAEPVATDVSIAVDVTLKDDAAPGAAYTVSFAGIYGDGNGEPGNEQDVSRSSTVTVKRSIIRVRASRTTQPEEPAVVGELPVSTLDSFSLEGGLPVNMILPENSTTLVVSLSDGVLPAFTRYSVDGGENWYMLYYGGSIRVDAAQMSVFEDGQCLLLDLYRTDWDSAQSLLLSAVAYTQEGRYIGEVVSEATAELFQTRTAETPLMLNASGPLELSVPESWAECEKEACLNRLELSDGMPVYREIIDDSVRIEFGEDDVTVAVGDVLPAAGTYWLTIRYKCGGVCFAESKITFFVNYSV